jgi:hypothetical protein
VVDQPAADVGDGLEAAVRVTGEARHLLPVVHPPAVDPGEVLPDLTAVERRDGTLDLVALAVVVDMVHAEQERVDRRPLEAERERLHDGLRHAVRL